MPLAFTYIWIYVLDWKISPVSDRLWKSRGSTLFHSIAEAIWVEEITLRWDANASQRMKMNNINAVNDSNDPIDEITFHFMNASG